MEIINRTKVQDLYTNSKEIVIDMIDMSENGFLCYTAVNNPEHITFVIQNGLLYASILGNRMMVGETKLKTYKNFKYVGEGIFQISGT